MISFVFYAHSSRIDNLLQTLRILEQKETKFWYKEIIVVFQDNAIDLKGIKTVGLNLKTYHKPKQCNIGVKLAKYPVVALLDSDRILPSNYFFDKCREIKRGQFITCSVLHNCKNIYSDNDILRNNIEYDVENKSKTNEIRLKNLFSGNTLFYKDQYLACGGMDENYFGYGFADNDMTRTIESHGMESVFYDLPEIHLWHEKEIIYESKKLSDFRIISAINMLYYCKKWSIHTESTDFFCKEIIKDFDKFEESNKVKFKKLYKLTYGI